MILLGAKGYSRLSVITEQVADFKAFLTIHVPFSGEIDLFQCHGQSYPQLHENIRVEPGELVISLRTSRDELLTFEQKVMNLLKQIERGLSSMRDRMMYLVPNLARRAEAKLRERQGQLASHTALLNQVKSISFPVRKREDAKQTAFVPVKPKQIELQPPPTLAKPIPEYELSLADYDEILRVVENMVTVFERSPSVFKTMEEEHLRTILLVGLNGIFQGAATGETFNGEGKTDILIRVKNDNIFIAECLIWDGPEHFKKKLETQLFRYSTWRDSKLAAIVFNRRKNFTDVVAKMREVVSSLGNRVTDLSYSSRTGCRTQMRRADDPQKRFVLTCLAFDVPS